MDWNYIDYCECFLKSNPENYKRLGFQTFSDLGTPTKWYNLIDKKIRQVATVNPTRNNPITSDPYFSVLSDLVVSLSSLTQPLFNYEFCRTIPLAFNRKNKEPKSKTLELIEHIFQIDLSHSMFINGRNPVFNSSVTKREEANICTYVSLGYPEIVRRKISMTSIMNSLIDFDLRNFPKGSVINDKLNEKDWVDIFIKNPNFWKIAFVNNKVVGYFNFHLIDKKFYDKWKLAKDEVIDIISDCGVVSPSDKISETWIYLDVLCIDENEIILGNYLHSLILKDLTDQLKEGMKELLKEKIKISGIIANGFTQRGTDLLKNKGFIQVGQHKIKGLNGFLTSLFELEKSKFNQFISHFS
jgi:hypothetical protein